MIANPLQHEYQIIASACQMYVSTRSWFCDTHFTIYLQNNLRKNSRFSSFSSHFAAFSKHFRPVFRTEKQEWDCRKALPSLLERRIRRFLTPVSNPKKPPFSCRKALPGLRRGCFRSATGPLLQRRKGPVAEPGGPYGSAAGGFLEKNGGGTAKRRCFFRSAVSILRFSRGPFFGILFLHHEGRTRGL